jgi:hypothetical protein
MYSTEQEIDTTMSQWMTSKRFTPDAKTNALIRQRVEEDLERLGGYPSVASFERAYLELLNEDAIQPFRGSLSEQPVAAPAIPNDVVAFIESPRTSASELRHRYRTDRTFRTQYDTYEKAKNQTQEEKSTAASLTVEEYRRLPAAVVVQKYRQNRVFRTQVDALIAKGLI